MSFPTLTLWYLFMKIGFLILLCLSCFKKSINSIYIVISVLKGKVKLLLTVINNNYWYHTTIEFLECKIFCYKLSVLTASTRFSVLGWTQRAYWASSSLRHILYCISILGFRCWWVNSCFSFFVTQWQMKLKTCCHNHGNLIFLSALGIFLSHQ